MIFGPPPHPTWSFICTTLYKDLSQNYKILRGLNFCGFCVYPYPLSNPNCFKNKHFICFIAQKSHSLNFILTRNCKVLANLDSHKYKWFHGVCLSIYICFYLSGHLHVSIYIDIPLIHISYDICFTNNLQNSDIDLYKFSSSFRSMVVEDLCPVSSLRRFLNTTRYIKMTLLDF